MTTKKNKIYSDFEKIQKKSKSVLQELEDFDFLDEIPHQIKEPRVPTAYDYGMMPSNEK